MLLSKACEYAIRASIYITLQSLEDRRTNLKDIAAEIESPEAFTAKILQQLVKADIIYSVKGAWGGFEIARKQMDRVRLYDIVTAIDGKFNDTRCVLGLKACSHQQPCPVHHKYKHIKSELIAMMRNTTLYEMSQGISEGLSYLKR